MTPTFYNTPARQVELTEAAQRWLGTPFHPHACLRGVGVDCAHLVLSILQETGAIKDWALPDYTMDGGDHRDTSLVTEWLEGNPRFQSLPEGEPALPGDLVCFRLGRVPHHVGLVIAPNRFIHAMRNYGVIQSQLDDPTFAKRLTATFRPVP